MHIIIIYLPLLGWIIPFFFGNWLSTIGAINIVPILIFITTIFSWWSFIEIALSNEPIYYKIFNWINADTFNVDYGFLFDVPTVSMLILITSVSFCVHYYACDYMGDDPHLPRFLSYLSLFTFFMIWLVTADNILQLFIGWEGVGICSYLLINFWYTRIQANKAAIKAMIMNRIGDIGIIIGIYVIYDMFQTLQFNAIFNIINTGYQKNYEIWENMISGYEIIALLLLFGAIGKSAQIGLHTWLPDAMEGPTPVSALIHAATMVTAGVFLLIRCSPIIDHAPFALSVITFVGALTAFLAASIGIFQYDIKKVIAYSTCSQLGYMIFTCGLSSYGVSLFHLLNHGFFKALLFLSAGNIIHSLSDEQDMRKLGGLIRSLPFTYILILIGSMSLMGFPYLTGYYSKDTIIELAQAPLTSPAFMAFILGIYSAGFTTIYSIKLIYYTFITNTNAQIKAFSNAQEVKKEVAPVLIFLAWCSLFIGYILKEAFGGLGTDFFASTIPSFDQTNLSIYAEFLPILSKSFTLMLSLFCLLLATIYFKYIEHDILIYQLDLFWTSFFSFFNGKWYFDIVHYKVFSHPIFKDSYDTFYITIDNGLLVFIGPEGIVNILAKLSFNLSLYHSGLLFFSYFIIILAITSYIMVSQKKYNYWIFIVILLCLIFLLLLLK